MYCNYYQAKVSRRYMWFLVASLRSFEHLVFDRTLDKENNIFEFFVPPDLDHFFMQIMGYFQEELIVLELKKLPNRLISVT